MSERKSIMFSINGTEYQISTSISYVDYKMFLKATQEETTDYKKIFAEFIHKKILTEDDNRPTVEEILEKGDVHSCVLEFLSSDEAFRVVYDSLSDKSNIYRDFFRAICDKCNSDFRKTIEKMPKYDWTKISYNLSESINARMNTEVLSSLNVTVNSLGDTLSKAIKSAAFKNISQFISNASEMLVRVSERITEMMRSIKIPTISDEEKEQIRLSYITWGMYGWTPLPQMPILYFTECPADVKEANNLALGYCKKKNMESLFGELRKMKGVKKSDLEEAIFCFDNKKYKACALVLLGLIDSKLIRLQKDEDRDRNNYRPVGLKASQNIFERIKRERNIEQQFIKLLLCENVFACIEVIFARGNDFKVQPRIINRNFVDHGMLTRKVIRKDCVQLFLLYYNLIKVLQL